MSERSMGGPLQAPDLGAELRALAGSIDWPPTPDVAAAVGRRLAAERPGPPAARSWPAWRVWPRFGRSFVLAIVLLLLVVAIAAAIVFGLPGLRIAFTSEPLPSPNVPVMTPAASAAGSASPSRPPRRGRPEPASHSGRRRRSRSPPSASDDPC